MHLKEESDDESCKADAILAFRTITTMLALIQAPIKLTDSQEVVISQDEHRELKVLDALAAVAVRRHEIVAAMAKDYKGSQAEVLVSVNNVGPALNISQHSENPALAGRKFSSKLALRWLIAPNPRDQDRKKNQNLKMDSLIRPKDACMTFVDPNTTISEELFRATPEKLLDTFLQTEW